MAHESNGISVDYWGNRLEVNADLIVQQHADKDYLTSWVEKLPKRARQLLIEHLRLGRAVGAGEQCYQLVKHSDRLLPAMLVHAATAGKRSYAITEVARSRLTDEQLQRCQLPSERFDRLALMWLLYLENPDNLELVFHLDRIQRRGFARMVLESTPHLHLADAPAFFSRSNIQRILDAHESEQRTRRRSICSEILNDGGGNFQVFIKPDQKSAFVSHGASNTFGFQPEWIVLEFEPDLHRVHMCSISPDIPVILANRIASEFFGTAVDYINESVFTYADVVQDFLTSLVHEPDDLPLVEVVAKNCGIQNAPQIRMNDTQNQSLAPALRHFATAFGNPLDHVQDIDSLKVHRFERRVKLIFERGPGEDELIVRYGDQPLTGRERREFERHMHERYGITVLSTEKRYAS